MLKVVIALISFVLANAAQAAQFTVFYQQTHYISDGINQIGESSYRVNTLKSDGPQFKLTTQDKFRTTEGTYTDGVEVTSSLSAAKVRALKNAFALCSNNRGQLETLKIQAGTFRACKQTTSEQTAWHIEGFPFAVKRIFTLEAGALLVHEAKEISARR